MLRIKPSGIAFAFILCAVESASGQANLPVRGHVYLPRTQGATVLSTYIDAEARRIVAVGDFLESAAVARRIHVESDRVAMENAVLWVDTYFKRKELNQQYRRAANPPYLDKQQRRDQQQQRRIFEMPQEVVSGDVSEEINWLLDRLVSDSASYQFVYYDSGAKTAELDLALSPADIKHVLLREAVGAQRGGRKFRANAPSVISNAWPSIFDGKEFDTEKTEFLRVRAQAQAEIAKGELSLATWNDMKRATERLESRFNQVYSATALNASSGTERVVIRQMGERFFAAQAAGSLRALTANNLDTYGGSYKFSGNSVVQLLRHCASNSLEFAPPEPGDETTYRRLFEHLKQIYLHFHQDQATPG
ncbi:MAG: hypothetical protein WD070_00045 [Pirellulaceae bacterium]